MTTDFIPFEKRQQMVKDAVAEFPKEFGLRGHEGVFTISEASSFVSEGRVVLYTYIRQADGKWGAFAKSSASQLRMEIRELPTP